MLHSLYKKSVDFECVNNTGIEEIRSTTLKDDDDVNFATINNLKQTLPSLQLEAKGDSPLCGIASNCITFT